MTHNTASNVRVASPGAANAARPAGLSGPRYVGLALALLAMIGAAVAGWVLSGLPADTTLNRIRLAVLPFDDPDSEEVADINRALAAAFANALINADPDNLAVVGPATTGRMLLAGLSAAEIAERTAADYILAGGHRAADHATFVEILASPDAESVLIHWFDLDENRPPHAPPDIVAVIMKTIGAAEETAGEEPKRPPSPIPGA